MFWDGVGRLCMFWDVFECFGGVLGVVLGHIGTLWIGTFMGVLEPFWTVWDGFGQSGTFWEVL